MRNTISKNTLTKTQYNFIQLFAALSLMGFWLVGAVVGFLIGSSNSIINIATRGVIALLSLVVIYICRRDFVIEKNKAIYVFYVFLLIAYSLRMFYDLLNGPFLSLLPYDVFINDTITIVVGVLLIASALITCRKYLNIDIIAKYVFWMGLIIILLSRSIMSSKIGLDAYESDRINLGSSLHTLSLVRIGAFEVIASLHLLFNSPPQKMLKGIYIIGAILGIWLALVSGARGGLVGLVVALGIYWVLSSRNNTGLSIISVVSVVVVLINIVPILNWLSNYFPVVGERMLLFVLYQDESNREIYREAALNYIFQNPILGFSYRVNTDITGYTTHNGILDVALALGIPMSIFFVFFFYVKSFILSARMMADRKYLFPTVMAVFSIVSSLSGSSVTSEGWHFSMCIMLSSYYYQFKVQNNQKLRNLYGK